MSFRGDTRKPATEPTVFVLCSSYHRSGTVDYQRTKIDITAFTNTEQAIPVPGAGSLAVPRNPTSSMAAVECKADAR